MERNAHLLICRMMERMPFTFRRITAPLSLLVLAGALLPEQTKNDFDPEKRMRIANFVARGGLGRLRSFLAWPLGLLA